MKKLLSLLFCLSFASAVYAQQLSNFLVEIDMRTYSSSQSLVKSIKAINVLKSQGFSDVIISGMEGRDNEGMLTSYLKPNSNIGKSGDLRKLFQALKDAEINYFIDIQIGQFSKENLLFEKRPSYFSINETSGDISINLNHKPAFKAIKLDVKNLALNLQANGLRFTVLQKAKPTQISNLITTVNSINEQLGKNKTLVIEGQGMNSLSSVEFDLYSSGENSWFYLSENFVNASRIDKIAELTKSGIPVLKIKENHLNSEVWNDTKSLVSLYKENDAFGNHGASNKKVSVKAGAEMTIFQGDEDVAIYVINKSSKKMKIKYKNTDEKLKGGYSSIFSGTPSFALSKKLKITLQPGEFAFVHKK